MSGRNGYVPVYTDGACSNNGYDGARSGVGVYFGPDSRHNVSRPLDNHSRQTNNSAEIEAAREAVVQARDQGITKLDIRTDSKFLVQSKNEWMPGWEANGWRTSSGAPVKNQAEFSALNREIRNSGMDVKFSHVPGHAGNPGNEAADRLARSGARRNY